MNYFLLFTLVLIFLATAVGVVLFSQSIREEKGSDQPEDETSSKYNPDHDKAILRSWYQLTGVFVHCIHPDDIVKRAMERLDAHEAMTRNSNQP